jgi:hypothetical protein
MLFRDVLESLFVVFMWIGLWGLIEIVIDQVVCGNVAARALIYGAIIVISSFVLVNIYRSQINVGGTILS